MNLKENKISKKMRGKWKKALYKNRKTENGNKVVKHCRYKEVCFNQSIIRNISGVPGGSTQAQGR